MTYRTDHLLEHAADLIDAGRRVALCLIVRARGSTPASAGTMMLVDDAAGMSGTVGGGCVEAELRRQVLPMITSGRSGVLSFKLDHDYGWDDGQICGGSIDVAVALPADAAQLRAVAAAHGRREPTELSLTVGDAGGDEHDQDGPRQYVLELPPRPLLLIAGAGHLGAALCRLAGDLDFDVAVFDDRPDLLERNIPDRASRVAGPIDEMIAREPIDEGTYIVIVTRGHRHDERVLKAVAERPARYIGMIGSRRKVKLTMDDLREAGVAATALERVHAPIGLDIGAITVNEIALSVAGQLVEVRRSAYRSPVRGPVPLAAGTG